MRSSFEQRIQVEIDKLLKHINSGKCSDYADYKGVTLATVYNWIKENKVETRKILRTTFVQV